MRCRDASRAIAAPDGAITPIELEAHLAACPRCARQVEADARLDRLWEATRPALPPPSSWDAVWDRIDRELTAPGAEVEAPTLAFPIGGGRSRRGRPIRLLAGLAAVGAVAAGLLVLLGRPDPGETLAGRPASPIRHEFEVPAGHTMLLHVDTGEERVVQVNAAAPDGDFTFQDPSEPGVDYFALFGWFEAIPALMASADARSASSTRVDDRSSPFDSFSP